jgi:hypothetical protein
MEMPFSSLKENKAGVAVKIDLIKCRYNDDISLD